MTIEKLPLDISAGAKVAATVNGLVDSRPVINPVTANQEISDYIKSPVEIPDLELWIEPNGMLKSDYSQPVDGESVEYLQDASGNGRHATLFGASALFSVGGGFGGSNGFKLSAGSRFQTSAFVDSSYGNALTTFIVTKAPSPLHSSLKVKLSIGSFIAWQGNTGTTRTRDYTLTGLTGYSGPSQTVQSVGGIDYMVVDTDKVRVSSGGEGITGTSSNITDVAPITGGSVSFTNEIVTIGGVTGTADYDWEGVISEVVIFSRALSSNELRRVKKYLADKYSTKETVLLLGNSLTSGTGSTSGAVQPILPTGDNYPSLFLKDNPQFDVRVDAYPGRRGNQLFNETPEYSGVAYNYSNVTAVVWEGTNSLPTSNSPQEAYDWIRRICLQKSANKRVVVMTVLYRNDVANVPKNNALTDQLNQLIRDNYLDFATDIVDLAADSRLADPSDLTYFFTDETHLNSVGYQVVANLLGAVVNI